MSTKIIVETSVVIEIDAVEKYCAHLGLTCSGRTIRAYRQDLRSFIDWFEGEYQMEWTPDQTTGVDLRNYRRYVCDEQNAAPATWNRRRIALRQFCAWCVKTGILSQDPSDELQPKPTNPIAPRWLEPKQLHRLLRQVELQVNTARSEQTSFLALRDSAIVGMMLHAGLRESEVVDLQLTDVSLTERSGKVNIRSGKGEKQGEIPLNAEVRRALNAWLVYGDHRQGGPGPLFRSWEGGALTTRQIQRIVGGFALRAGVECTPHDLRHTFAKRMLDAGVPLTTVSKLLRHARLDTTARYVTPGWGDYEQAVEKVGG